MIIRLENDNFFDYIQRNKTIGFKIKIYIKKYIKQYQWQYQWNSWIQ